MAYCNSCGNAIRGTASFCTSCGAEIREIPGGSPPRSRSPWKRVLKLGVIGIGSLVLLLVVFGIIGEISNSSSSTTPEVPSTSSRDQITTELKPTRTPTPVPTETSSQTNKSQIQSQAELQGSPQIYRKTIPTCEQLGEEPVGEKLIYLREDSEQVTGLVRNCKKTTPRDLEFLRETTMWVQEFQSEENAHDFLELMSLGDVQPLTIPWEPELKVDEYLIWQRRGLGEMAHSSLR